MTLRAGSITTTLERINPMSMFDRPAPAGDNFDCRTHVGALLVIEPLSLERQVSTVNGAADAIKANVYVISQQGTVAEEVHNALLFQKLLVSRLQQSIGRKVLGVLTGQPGVTRDGKSVPYDLDDPSDAMEAAAVRAMTAHSLATQPADPWATQQAPAGWGAAPQQGNGQAGPWQRQPAQPPAGAWGQQQAPAGPPAQPPAPWGQQQLPQPPMPTPPASADPWANVPPPAAPSERPPWEQTEQAPAAPWGQQ